MPNRKYPPIMALKAFEAVARHNSFKDAANELSVTPGALSQQVKNLEDYLGVQLFVRKSRQIETTAQGKTLKSGLVDAFKLIRKSVDAIQPQEQSMNLIIASDPSFAAKWLAPRLTDFMQQHPDISVKVESNLKPDDKGDSLFDVGIRLGKQPSPGLFNESLGNEGVVVVASPDFVRTHGLKEPRDVMRVPLLTEDCLSFCPQSPTWDSWFEAAGLPPGNTNRGINFGAHAEQAIDAAIAGGGVLLTRHSLVQRDIEKGRLAMPFALSLPTHLQYFLICPFEKLEDPKVRNFIRWIKPLFQMKQIVQDVPANPAPPDTQLAV